MYKIYVNSNCDSHLVFSSVVLVYSMKEIAMFLIMGNINLPFSDGEYCFEILTTDRSSRNLLIPAVRQVIRTPLHQCKINLHWIQQTVTNKLAPVLHFFLSSRYIQQFFQWKKMSFHYRISHPDHQHHKEVGVNRVCQLNDICKLLFFKVGCWNGKEN